MVSLAFFLKYASITTQARVKAELPLKNVLVMVNAKIYKKGDAILSTTFTLLKWQLDAANVNNVINYPDRNI